MLSNILRIVLGRLLFHKVMDERNKVEKKINAQEQDVGQRRITANMSLEERKEILREQKQQRERFGIRPLMARTYETNMLMLYLVMRIFIIILTVASVFLVFCFHNGKIDNYEIAGLITICFMWGLVWIIKYGYKYMKNTKYIFYQNRISICRFKKKEKVITYDEVREQIKKKKIKVHHGRFEIPYCNGYIPVYTWGDDVPTEDFYQFINEQCGTNLPSMEKKDNEIVHKIGVGWVMRNYFALPILGFAAFGGALTAIGDYGIENGLIKMIQFFLQFYFSPINIFGVIGIGCILVGFLLTVKNYFPAKRHFKNYEDIKVSLF